MALCCLIVDDNDRFREAARRLLEHEGITVVGEASTSAEAVRQAGELRPTVALVDIDLGEESGFDVASRLSHTTDVEPPSVILISTYSQRDFADMIEASPAVAFLPKPDLSARAIQEILERSGRD
ncbi:response regulator [Planotetraspora sp. GP83]|uniref:response regulator n=1 Tax=Planotetraspora sp. GP83 TaxID=3156264 RepID=UPI0035132DE7